MQLEIARSPHLSRVCAASSSVFSVFCIECLASGMFASGVALQRSESAVKTHHC